MQDKPCGILADMLREPGLPLLQTLVASQAFCHTKALNGLPYILWRMQFVQSL